MSEMPNTTTSPQSPALDARLALAFCRFSGGYWRGATARQALGLTLGLAMFLALGTAAGLALNLWLRWFFDAVEKKDFSAFGQAASPSLRWFFDVASMVGISPFGQALLVVGLIIAAMAAIGVGIVITRETLQVRWRAWLIDRLVGLWVGERRFYQLNASRTEPANPEYRIADDTRWAVEHATDLAIGLVIAVLNAATFISVLWTVGGSYQLSLGTGSVTIPAYMVLVAIGYGALMSVIMMRVGWRLPGIVYAKNEREGDFRFAMMRLRENAESVALMSGHVAEQSILRRMFDQVVQSWVLVIRKHGHLTWITNSTGPLLQNQIVPLLFAAPKYLSGELSFGQVMQLAAAFVIVQGAISWIVDNFNRLSECYASAKRIMDIVEACEAADAARATQGPTIVFEAGPDSGLDITDLTVHDPFGAPVLAGVALAARPGATLHISGDTSAGKSTLARALAGLWTRGEGRIRLPNDARVMVLPQKPYLPLGSLADAIAYPETDRAVSDAGMRRVLADVGLAHLGDRLADFIRWDQQLSNGERQRLGIARLLLHKPGVVVLDDALSALDEAAEIALVRRLRSALPETIIISLGQTQPPAGLYDDVLALQRRDGMSTVRSHLPTSVH